MKHAAWIGVWLMCVGFAGTVTNEVIVNPDGSSDLYVCMEDSPPPCVWDCTTDGNRICGTPQ